MPRLDRRTFTLAIAGLAAGRPALAGPCPPPRVLFVCPAGTVKSAIAREMLKARAAHAGVPVRAQSRGVHVEDHVSPALAASLKADGIDPAAEPARPLRDEDARQADLVIAFDEAAQVPSLSGARVWDTPSWNADYAGAKAATATRIDALVAELRARQAGPCRDEKQ